MSFPLYDRLAQDIPSKDLTCKQKQEFMEKVRNIDNNGFELIYVLVQTYNKIYNDEELSTSLPYNGKLDKTKKKGEENVTWNFLDFPQKLRYILYKFIIMHMKNMEEEKARCENLP